MLKRILILVLFLFSFVFQSAFADTNYNFNAFISDNAGIISKNTEDKINAFLWDLQKKTGTDIAVVTVNSLDGRSIEETALEIGRKYKLGKKGEDNGAVILVAPNERKMRIEIGYGLEGIIPDGKAGRIRDTDMLPYFQKGDYESGIHRGSYSLANAVAKGYSTELSINSPVPERPKEPDNTGFILFLMILLLCIRFGIIPIYIPFCGGYRTGGFGSGSFGGFGGGGVFGGGGASGSW